MRWLRAIGLYAVLTVALTWPFASNLRVMDASALSLCMDNGTPIVVFDLNEPGNIVRAARGEPIGTTVSAQIPEGVGSRE